MPKAENRPEQNEYVKWYESNLQNLRERVARGMTPDEFEEIKHRRVLPTMSVEDIVEMSLSLNLLTWRTTEDGKKLFKNNSQDQASLLA